MTFRNPTLRFSLAALILAGTCAVGHAQETKVSRLFPAEGIKAVVFRAGAATDVTVQRRPNRRHIAISGIATGGSKGYHSGDPNQREIKPQDWGFNFVAKQFGDVLVISTYNETRFMHHVYVLRQMELWVPVGVDVKVEQRKLSGDGNADLSRPRS